MAQINIKKNDSSSVSTPPSGVEAIFIANDGNLYTKNSFGTVSVIAGGGSGTSGSSGSSGTSGLNGSSGSSGSSGTSGLSGTDGSSGTSGVSGTSGTTPAAGAAGLVAGPGTNSIQSNTTLTPGATAAGCGTIALGICAGNSYANPSAADQILIGRDTGSYWSGHGDGNSIAIGNNAKFRNGAQIVIGLNARNGGQNNTSVVIGTNAIGDSPFGAQVVIGPAASDSNYWGSAVIIGQSACYQHCAGAPAEGSPLTAVGNYSIAGPNSTSFGWNAVSCSKATSIGMCSRSNFECSVALGMCAVAGHTGSVAIGFGMTTSVVNHTHILSLYISSAPTYADNSAAISGGLIAGQVYKTSSGALMIVY